MTSLSIQQVQQAISGYLDPLLDQDYVSLDVVSDLDISEAEITLKVNLPYPAASLLTEIEQGLREQLQSLAADRKINIELLAAITESNNNNKAQQLPGVKNIVAVASGKGGVGKSTTTVNLALALHAEGARVGILDADIYGPSQSIMLGVAEDFQPETKEGKFWLPVEAHGLQSMSMGYLVNEKTPMVWRGPMVSGALQQMLNQTLWEDLDYLLIDMPPGTGDIQLTLAQKVPVSGAVIVTTPQDIALLDAKKGIEMFSKVSIPVLGIVENMSMHTCSQCGHTEAIFGAGGGERIAEEYQTSLLGQLPLDLQIRKQADSGQPTVISDPESSAARSYRSIAQRMAAQVFKLSQAQTEAFPNIEIVDD